ncbi:MAG: tetratricopeptide repeat protein [Roseomonas sp.]|nr:tetratricopeptide repeat protein [Roseomonas sp.]
MGLSGAAMDPLVAQAVALHQQGRIPEARQAYQRIRSQDPGQFVAWHMGGVAALQAGDTRDAHALIRKALALRPNDGAALINLGIILHRLGKLPEALQAFKQGMKTRADDPSAHNNFGNLLRDMQRHEAALQSFGRALALNPENVLAYANRGTVLRDLDRLEEALADFDQALARAPGYAIAHYKKGEVLAELRRVPEALAHLDAALRLEPQSALFHASRGEIFQDTKNLDAALRDFDAAIRLEPEIARYHQGRGLVLQDMRRFPEAAVALEQALKLDRSLPLLQGQALQMRMTICDWRDFDKTLAALEASVASGFAASPPFSLLVASASRQLQRQCAASWLAREAKTLASVPQRPDTSGRRIRIGYFSADFHNHATAYLMTELFERHDRTSFELIAYSFGPIMQDAMRARLRAAFDAFHEVSHLSDGDIAALARRDGIDIAVDLKGFTEGGRNKIFAHRAAPLQVSYLGYPGTMAADYMDYLVADPVLIPPEHRADYAEKIMYVPHSYQVNDGTRRIPDRKPERAALGLPEAGFVFCCFNNNYKITPRVFDIWMRLLRAVPGSVFWLLADNPGAAANLRRAAIARGVEADRLVFAERIGLAEHLARHAAADLCLDTLPYNAHTTASDALWAGLPVLTQLGQSFAGRVGASLLTALGLPELITESPAAYEARALELARDPARLGGIRRKLWSQRLTATLFDAGRFARHLEAGFEQILQRHQLGLPPDHIVISEIPA